MLTQADDRGATWCAVACSRNNVRKLEPAARDQKHATRYKQADSSASRLNGAGHAGRSQLVFCRGPLCSRSVVVKLHRSHFGSRYKSGCCGHAGLLPSVAGCWQGARAPACALLALGWGTAREDLQCAASFWHVRGRLLRAWVGACCGVRGLRVRLHFGRWATAREDLRVLPAFATRSACVSVCCGRARALVAGVRDLRACVGILLWEARARQATQRSQTACPGTNGNG